MKLLESKRVYFLRDEAFSSIFIHFHPFSSIFIHVHHFRKLALWDIGIARLVRLGRLFKLKRLCPGWKWLKQPQKGQSFAGRNAGETGPQPFFG